MAAESSKGSILEGGCGQQMDQNQLEALKRKVLSSFKVVFKLKVVDTFKPHVSATVTMFDQGEETFQALKPGDRLRLMNV
jgi:hypothetical protein